jgi:hypothetical protein
VNRASAPRETPFKIQKRKIGCFEVTKEIDYRRIDEDVCKSLPGELVSQNMQRVHTITRSNGDDRYQIIGESWTVENPMPEDVAEVINGLFTPGNYMAILAVKNTVVDPSEYIGNCSYVQTAVLGEDDSDRREGKYAVEAQFVYGWDKDKGLANRSNPDYEQEQYRKYTNDVEEVKEIFKAFVSGAVPDVTGWTLQAY